MINWLAIMGSGMIVAKIVGDFSFEAWWGLAHGGLELLAYALIGQMIYPGVTIYNNSLEAFRPTFWLGIVFLFISAIGETFAGHP